MKGKKKGITLIELMIIVVAVGLIAAFAMPHFVKGLSKDEATETLGKLYSAEKTYHEIYGVYAGRIEDLSVTMPNGPWCEYTLILNQDGYKITAVRQSAGVFYVINQDSTLYGSPDP